MNTIVKHNHTLNKNHNQRKILQTRGYKEKQILSVIIVVE